MQSKTRDTSAEIKLDPTVFDCDFNEGLVHQAVVTYLNNARSGNSAQKTRAEVRGGGRKPWNQKGSGRARAGTISSPIWRKGGVTFASKKRDYTQKINKKMYKRALRSIISELYRLDNLVIISDFKCDSLKTKDFLKKMDFLKVDGALIVMSEIGEYEYLASRNLIQYDICDVEALDPVLLLSYNQVLMTESAIRQLEEQLS
ncbi:MAG: 50S ribosomal protein L4 [Legionellales bacterium RIFCSPHIGHO2_12_FULL_35_11]|nr:MAG: 50S ribosomal protein L4 [Legionellales bacterium RIFCSPHIGHO2_12_FULL_35_11]